MVVRITKQRNFKSLNSPGGVRRKSGRLETAATIKRRAREKKLGGRIEVIGGKEVFIKVKEPELFTEKGKKAVPDKEGVIRGFSRADLVKKKALEKKISRDITRSIVRAGITPSITSSLNIKKIPKKEIKILGRIEADKVGRLEATRRKLLGIQQKQIGRETSDPTKSILAGAGLGVVGFGRGLKGVVDVLTKPIESAKNIGRGLKELASNPRGTVKKLGEDFKIDPAGTIGEFLGFQAGANAVVKATTKNPISKAITKERFIRNQPKSVQTQVRKILSKLDDNRINKIIEDANKLPKIQRNNIIKQLEVLKKQNRLNTKVLKGKEVGIVTKVDKQLLSKNIKQGVTGKIIKNDIVTLSDNKLFIVNKKNVPKIRSKSFDIEVVTVSRGKTRGLEVTRANTQSFKAKFNTKTGKIDIISKGRNLKNIDPREAFNIIQRVKPGAKEIISKRKIGFKPSKRIITKKKKLKIVPSVEITRKGIKKKFEVQPIKEKISVKGGVRVIKEAKAIDRISKTIKKRGVFKPKEFISLQELKIIPKIKKLRGKKLADKIEKSKPSDIFVFDEKTGTGFRLTKQQTNVLKSKSPSIVTNVKVQPVKIKDDFLFTPKLVPESERFVKRVPTRSVSKPVRVVKPRKIPKTKIRVVKAQVRKIKSKPTTESIIKKKSVSKPRKPIETIIRLKPISKVIIKSDVKRIQDFKRISSIKKKLKVKPKPVLPKVLPILKFDNKGKKVKKDKKTSKKKPKLKFTPTIAGEKKTKSLKDDELILFTGLEFR